MVGKNLRRAGIGYYWQPPTWARKLGCAIEAEALGTDYAYAKRRCDETLNLQFKAWLDGCSSMEPSRPHVGTFAWLITIYKSSPKYRRLASGTRADYDAVLNLVAYHRLKDGRRFGDLSLASITPGAADLLHAKLLEGGKGNRQRTAKLAMDVCRRAWRVAFRDRPSIVPTENPFSQMGIAYSPNITRAATYFELITFVQKADELGHHSLGTAALIAFFWLQREEDIFLRLAWTNYRPAAEAGVVRIFHHKNGELVDVPLIDHDGTDLWPELTSRLDRAVRLGTLVVMRDRADLKRKVHLPWATSAINPVRHVQRIVAQIRDAAGLPSDLTFTSFRHGGHTDSADAGLTDAQIRALSGHKTAAMISVYAKRTKDQRLDAARKRLEARRTKRGNLSE